MKLTLFALALFLHIKQWHYTHIISTPPHFSEHNFSESFPQNSPKSLFFMYNDSISLGSISLDSVLKTQLRGENMCLRHFRNTAAPVMTATLALLVVLLVLESSVVLAGDNPFTEKKIILDQAAFARESSLLALTPIKDGERVSATVDVSSTLNVRAGPWGDILGNLGPGAQITLVGQVGDWYRIEYGGKEAYVHSAYVLRQGEKAKPFPRQGWVNASTGLNVRRVPNGDVVGKLRDQSPVEILGVVGEYYKIKWDNDNEAFVSRNYIDTDMPSAPGADQVEKANFVGYVTADAGLNVRTAPWGPVETSLPSGIAVQVVGKVQDWYQISYNGKIRYVHENFIGKSQTTEKTTIASDAGATSSPGSLQNKIVKEAQALVGSKKFRTADVDYGNLACAKVVSTALKNAGATDRVVLNCRSLISDLKAKSWKEVSVPPFQEGDVITWKTYDYTGDGIKDPDTHVGIMVKQGNTYVAMNNSSRLRTPRCCDPYAVGPISRVLRKV